jgi:hypothetical protein
MMLKEITQGGQHLLGLEKDHRSLTIKMFLLLEIMKIIPLQN